MWSGKWGASLPHIKEEKPLSAGPGQAELSQGGHNGNGGSPVTTTLSPGSSDTNSYGTPSGAVTAANFGGAPFSNNASNTTQANNEILYETMSQVYPALSSSLGMTHPIYTGGRNL